MLWKPCVWLFFAPMNQVLRPCFSIIVSLCPGGLMGKDSLTSKTKRSLLLVHFANQNKSGSAMRCLPTLPSWEATEATGSIPW